MQSGLKKQYGLLTAISMVVGTVIGSGAFFKAQAILDKTDGDMPMGILAWVVGGVVMLFCILAFSVMSQKYEKVNGIVDYSEATVGSKYSYFVGWFITTLYTPGMTSVLAWLSARYFMTFICSVNPDFHLTIPFSDGGAINGPETLCLAAFILIAVYAINSLSAKLTGIIQVSATFIKLVPLILMAVVGTIYGCTHQLDSTPLTILQANMDTARGDFTTLFGATVASAFAYEGWIIATSINSELKNSKRNLPIALIGGSAIIIAVYIFYYIGVAGGASVDTLRHDGATTAFTTVFGNVFGNVLNLFVAISCLGTLNGLMVGCTRGMYSLAVRGYGPKAEIMKQVDKETKLPANSGIVGLLIIAGWLLYYYGANLVPYDQEAGIDYRWFGYFNFDSSELPIITIYAFYIPIFIMFMKKEKGLSFVKRFLLPSLGLIGSVFMVCAALYSHGYLPYIEAKTKGEFSCPVLFYLIVFTVIMAVGGLFARKKKDDNQE